MRRVLTSTLLITLIAVASQPAPAVAAVSGISTTSGPCTSPNGHSAAVTFYVDDETGRSISGSYTMDPPQEEVTPGYRLQRLVQDFPPGESPELGDTAPEVLNGPGASGLTADGVRHQLPGAELLEWGRNSNGRYTVEWYVTFTWGTDQCTIPIPVIPTGADVADDGDPTPRLAQPHPVAAAISISITRFSDVGAETDGESIARTPGAVVLSRDDLYVDSLAAAPLTANAPMLFTATDRLYPETAEEIKRVLPITNPVYLLGGEAALSRDVEAQVRALGYEVERLQGGDRIATSVTVATEVRALRPDVVQVALARAYSGDDVTSGWADSVTGGAWAATHGVPILVSDVAEVSPVAQEWLNRFQPDTTVLLGGTTALSSDLEAQVPGPVRVGGGDRTATAAAVSTELIGVDPMFSATFLVINGYRTDGWAFGLAGAGLAADAGTGLLIAGDTLPQATRGLLDTCDTNPAVTANAIIIGDDTVVGAAVAAEIDRLTRDSCP